MFKPDANILKGELLPAFFVFEFAVEPLKCAHGTCVHVTTISLCSRIYS